MTEFDDLAPLRKKEFGEAVAKLEELLGQGRRAFLLGAGASKCAGLPLTAELTSSVLAGDCLDAKSKELLLSIQSGFSGAAAPNIEDYLSELVDLLAIADRRELRGASDTSVTVAGKPYDRTELKMAVEQIKKGIYEVIHVKAASAMHRRLVRRVHRPTRPGKAAPWQAIDYFVLNYDTILEDSLALERAPFADGFDGGATGWWSPNVYDRVDVVARVFKLHGSVNWCDLPGDPLPRRFGPNVDVDDDRRIAIWPASTKYRETQNDPFAQLIERARKVLRPEAGAQVVLVICGYSFSDSHINVEIERALRASAGNLTIVALTDGETPQGKLKEWREDKAISNQLLVYARRGFFHGEASTVVEDDLPWWKFENLVRLLEGER